MVITYRVAAGDTLTEIAQRYGTTVNALVSANKIKDPDLIQIGQRLTIPVNSTTEKDYSKIGKQVEKCLADVENLPSFKALLEML